MAHGYIEPGKHIYVPEDPDPLRDGLYRGFWAHRQQPKPQPETQQEAPDGPKA